MGLVGGADAQADDEVDRAGADGALAGQSPRATSEVAELTLLMPVPSMTQGMLGQGGDTKPAQVQGALDDVGAQRARNSSAR